MTVRLPLMASLAAHRRAQHLRGSRVAAAIGVAPETLSRWESGQRSPRWALLIAYAAELGRRVVVWDDGVLAEGLDVPGLLVTLRQRAGLTQAVLAGRLRVSRNAVSIFETRPSHQMATVEAYVTALGAELRHLPLEAP